MLPVSDDQSLHDIKVVHTSFVSHWRKEKTNGGKIDTSYYLLQNHIRNKTASITEPQK